MSRVEELLEQHPNRNVAFTAIDRLKNQIEIKAFFKDYIDWLKTSSDPVCQCNPQQAALLNLAYVLSHYNNPELSLLWQSAIPELKDPEKLSLQGYQLGLDQLRQKLQPQVS